MPAATGLRSSQTKIVTSIAAVISELCPDITHRIAAGESISAIEQAVVRDVAARDREEQRAADQRPHQQRLEIAQLPERRREEHDARRIRPVLPRIVRPEQRFERTR